MNLDGKNGILDGICCFHRRMVVIWCASYGVFLANSVICVFPYHWLRVDLDTQSMTWNISEEDRLFFVADIMCQYGLSGQL